MTQPRHPNGLEVPFKVSPCVLITDARDDNPVKPPGSSVERLRTFMKQAKLKGTGRLALKLTTRLNALILHH